MPVSAGVGPIHGAEKGRKALHGHQRYQCIGYRIVVICAYPSGDDTIGYLKTDGFSGRTFTVGVDAAYLISVGRACDDVEVVEIPGVFIHRGQVNAIAINFKPTVGVSAKRVGRPGNLDTVEQFTLGGIHHGRKWRHQKPAQ
ncbi:MAG: hypothetical protein IPL65_03700 [Lewinellaceae bacterium]|nr:hypothetical protein [Lewinellaceae bacterium]